MYDGTEVSGSEVLNVIRKFSDETFGIQVVTSKKKESYFYIYRFDPATGELGKKSQTDYKTAQDVTSPNYINPTGRFEGSVVKDGNGTIIGLIFTQV